MRARNYTQLAAARSRTWSLWRPGQHPSVRARARWALIFATVAVLGGPALAVVPSATSPAAAGITGDKTKIAQLEQKIAAQGAAVQTLVTREDRVTSQLATIRSEIALDQSHLTNDRRKESTAAARLRTAAIEATSTTPLGIRQVSPASSIRRTSPHCLSRRLISALRAAPSTPQ